MRELVEPDWRARVTRPRKWKGELLDELKEAYQDPQLSLQSISALYDISPANICGLAREHRWRRRGLPPRLRAMSAGQRKIYRKLLPVVGRRAAEREALRQEMQAG